MHIFRIFGVNFGKPARLVFETKPQPAPAEGGGDIKPATPEDLKYAEEAKERHAEGLKTVHEEKAILEANVREKELKDKLGEGPAKNYVETFRKFSRTTGFEALTATLEAATELRAGDVPFNFEDWQTLKDQESIALFIEDGIVIGTFPGGEGSREFLEGLKLNPEGSTPEQVKKMEASNKVLGEMTKILKEHFDAKKDFKKDTAEQAENKPFGMKTIGEGVKTLMKNFKREDAMGKIAILGAVGIGIYLLHRYKDSQCIPGWEKATLSKTLLWIGAGVGINYLSGKVSPDGKTLLQRIDWGKDIEELKDDNVMKAFAIKNGMDEDQEKLRTMYKVLNVDVRRLYELYRDAKLNSVSTGKKEIDPKQLGFYKGEVNGEDLYEIIENLVQFTAINEQTRRREEDAKERNIKYVKPSGTEMAEWKANADAAFEEKYFNGPLGNHKQTLFDVIVNEYRTTNYQEVIASWKAQELEQRAYAGIEKGSKIVYGKAVDYGTAAGEWAVDKSGKLWGVANKKVFEPVGSWAAEKYTTYNLYGFTPLFLKNRLSALQENDIKKVLPDEFAVDVTSPDKATIMGFPETPFEIKERDSDKKRVALIEGLEFLLDDGITGNQTNSDKLKQKFSDEIKLLVWNRAKKDAVLKDKTPRWDKTEKKWFVDDVKFQYNSIDQEIGFPTEDTISVGVTIESDRKALKFFDGKEEIKDFDKVDEAHRDAVIKGEVLKKFKEGFGKRLEPAVLDLPITDIAVRSVTGKGSDPSDKPWIEGKIAGLEFTAVVGTSGKIEDGLNFYDAVNGIGGVEILKIDKDKGGEKFVHALSEKILKESAFAKQFIILRSQIDNAGEGFFARMGEAYKTKKWWIIPTNPEGAINGKILQNQWAYTLEYKKFEAIKMFENAMLGHQASELDENYQTYIYDTQNQLSGLSVEIAKYGTDEEKADHFKEFLTGLEDVNYPSQDYRTLFHEFKDMVERYNFKGLESVKDLGLADEALETYQLLWRAWHGLTGEYASNSKWKSLSQADKDKQKDEISHATNKIRKRLEEASADGVVEKKELPPTDDSKEWLK